MVNDPTEELRCEICTDRVGLGTEPYMNWELHELAPDEWYVLCQPCVDVIGYS